MSGLRDVLYEAQLSQQMARSDSSLADEFFNSAGYTLVQMPAEGLSQLSNNMFGTNLAPRFVDAPTKVELGSQRWFAQQTGSAVGAMPWLIGLHHVARGGSRALIAGETANTVRLHSGIAMSKNALGVWESASVGFAYGGVLTPVDPNRTDFWRARLTNGTVGAVTFAAMSKSTQLARDGMFGTNSVTLMASGAKGSLTGIVGDRARLAAAGTVGGLVAGPLDATLHSAIDKGTLPSTRDLAESTYSFAFIGGGLGAFGPRPRGTTLDVMERAVRKGERPVDTRLARSAETTANKVDPLIARGDTAILPRLELQAPAERTSQDTLQDAQALVSELTTQFPQVGPDGKLNYYLAGSLGTMVVLAGDGYRVLDPSRLPEVQAGETRQIPAEAREGLQRFIRQVGDLDYVPMPEYTSKDHRMRKGGGSVYVDSLSERARSALKEATPGSAVMTDPLSPADGHRVIEVDLKGRRVYVAAPEASLAYKMVHFAESFGKNEGKSGQMMNDVESLIKSQEAMKAPAEIEADVYRTLFAYNAESKNGLYLPYQMPEFDGPVRRLFERVMERDPDHGYLPEINFGKERSISFLRLLHTFDTPEAKRLAIDIVNENRAKIDKWYLLSTENNRTLLADFLLRNPEMLSELHPSIKVGENPTRQWLADQFKVHVWVLDKFSSRMPADTPFDRTPAPSDVLTMLGRVNARTAAFELPILRELLNKGVDPFAVNQVLDHKHFNDPELRSRLFERMSMLGSQPGTEAVTKFLKSVDNSLRSSHYDSTTNRYVSLSPDEVLFNVRRVLSPEN